MARRENGGRRGGGWGGVGEGSFMEASRSSSGRDYERGRRCKTSTAVSLVPLQELSHTHSECFVPKSVCMCSFKRFKACR